MNAEELTAAASIFQELVKSKAVPLLERLYSDKASEAEEREDLLLSNFEPKPITITERTSCKPLLKVVPDARDTITFNILFYF